MFQTVLCPVDGSPQSLEALRVAADLAARYQARLRLLHVVPVQWLDLLANRPPMGEVDLLPKDLERRLVAEGERILAAALEGLPEGAEAEQVEGVPAEVICAEAEKADVVVIGSRGMGRLRGMLMGSVSQYVTTHAKCPVMVVH